MSSPLVVEDLNVVEQGHLGVAATGEVFSEFVLDRGEPTLHHGVVVAIAPTTHAAGHPMHLEDPLVVLAGIRTSLVGVMQETRGWLPACQGHVEGLAHKMAIVDRTDRPANQEARVEVEDRREIELPTAADHELGGIADPALTNSCASRFAATG